MMIAWAVIMGTWLAVYGLAETKHAFSSGLFSCGYVWWVVQREVLTLLPVALLVPFPWLLKGILRRHHNVFGRILIVMAFICVGGFLVLIRVFDTYESVYRNFIYHNPSLQELVSQFRTDHDMQKQHPVSAGKAKFLGEAKSCPKCKCSADTLDCVWYSSPWFLWKNLAGRAGWMTMCTNCNHQVDFFLEEMN